MTWLDEKTVRELRRTARCLEAGSRLMAALIDEPYTMGDEITGSHIGFSPGLPTRVAMALEQLSEAVHMEDTPE